MEALTHVILSSPRCTPQILTLGNTSCRRHHTNGQRNTGKDTIKAQTPQTLDPARRGRPTEHWAIDSLAPRLTDASLPSSWRHARSNPATSLIGGFQGPYQLTCSLYVMIYEGWIPSRRKYMVVQWLDVYCHARSLATSLNSRFSWFSCSYALLIWVFHGDSFYVEGMYVIIVQ